MRQGKEEWGVRAQQLVGAVDCAPYTPGSQQSSPRLGRPSASRLRGLALRLRTRTQEPCGSIQSPWCRMCCSSPLTTSSVSSFSSTMS